MILLSATLGVNLLLVAQGGRGGGVHLLERDVPLTTGTLIKNDIEGKALI